MKNKATNITIGGDTTNANSIGIENIHSKIVYQYDLNGNFIKKWDCGLREIGRNFGKSHVNISRCCLGKIKRAYNSIWFFDYKGDKIDPYKRENCGYFLSKKVYQYDLCGNFIKEWESASEYIKLNNKKTTVNISSCCNGKAKSAYGYIWSFNLNIKIPLDVD